MDSVLQISGVTKRFGDLCAVDDVSLTVPPGEIFALLGPNGAGKTTLIGCIAGLVQDFDGSIDVGGYDVVRDYPVVRQLIGLVPQELNFDGFFKSRHILEYQGGFFGIRHYRRRTRELLEIFSLGSKAEDNSRWLSGGMKRRLMICKALVHNPAVLFLDEPTAGVDVELREELWEYVRRLRDRGTTIVLTTHYLEEAEQLADRIGMIQNGRLVLVEDRDDLLNHYGERWLEITFAEEVTASLFEDIPELRTEFIDRRSLRFAFKDSTRANPEPQRVMPAIWEQIKIQGLTPLRVDGGRSRLEEIFRGVMAREREASA
ncbi:MAG: ATP-binding cassette domain-containing protein [Verrucomicrobia bacterium]|nr:ATP-binding cassette domain-containing protein [Verrucomicrobiota bacterium]